MARRTGPRTEFQKWLNDALVRCEMDLAELARRTESDYTHLWKIARGDPAKYPTSRRPGYELTESIGIVLGDKQGALVAAGYWQESDDAVKPPATSGTSSVGRIRVINEQGKEIPLSEAMRTLIEMAIAAPSNHPGHRDAVEVAEVESLESRTDDKE